MMCVSRANRTQIIFLGPCALIVMDCIAWSITMMNGLLKNANPTGIMAKLTGRVGYIFILTVQDSVSLRRVFFQK
jgi:hypothetical protein